MALAAVSRDIERLWFPEVALARILRSFFCIGIRIAAMAIIAGQAARFMNVVIEQFRGRAEACVGELDMAFDAGAFFLGVGGCTRDDNDYQRKCIGPMRPIG